MRVERVERIAGGAAGTTLRAVGFVATLAAAGFSGRASGQIVINEFLANNGRTNFDEEGDAEDWLELYNRSPFDVDLVGWGLSDDPGEPFRWVFPGVTVPAGGYLLVWLSGKDRVAVSPDTIAGDLDRLAFRPTLIPREAEWRYLVAAPGTAGPPSGWDRIGFDVGSFQVGQAGFGYGDGDDFTELPANTNAVFVRREFRVPDPAHLANLILQIDYDDGFVAFLNGTRVAERNAPAGALTFDVEATAKREAGTPERFDLTPFLDRLVPGTNVLAIVGLNDLDPTSSDMSLDPELGIVPSVLHTNFRIDDEGEEIVLTSPERETVDGIAYPRQTQDHSYGHSPNGSGAWRYLLTPTPEAPNDTLSFTEPISTSVTVMPSSGRFAAGPVSVAMTAEPLGAIDVLLTTDGSEPTLASPRYVGPISISANTVLRVAGFISGERATEIRSHSFFIGPSFSGSRVDLPILSISMTPADFVSVQTDNGARGRGSERAAYFEYFDGQGERIASTGFGLRLHGGAGRGGDFNTKKAYKAYFRGAYGDSKLRIPIIPETPVDEFDKLVLRGGFNDSFRTNARATYLRDELIRDLHEDMGALASHGSWCQIYVNMQYRGVYNVVERMDEEFLASYFEGDDWDVIKTGNDVLVGSIDEWNRLRNFIVDNDMSNEALYRQALRLLDVENFTSYMLVNIWAQNQDWPHNNWYAARPRRPDGKWIFLSWDAEFGIGLIPEGFSSDTFEFVFTRNGYLRDVFERLLASPIYRTYLRDEVERHAAQALDSQSVLARIEALRSTVAIDIDDELRLMNRTRSQWDTNVAAMQTFARNRTGVFVNFMRSSPRLAGPPDSTPVLLSVAPSTVVNTGTTNVVLAGQNLATNLEVLVGGERATVITSVGTVRLTVRLPFSPDVVGPVAIRLRNQTTGQTTEETELLNVEVPAPLLTSITPESGDGRGGETVRVEGLFFFDGVRVFFGAAESPSVTRVGAGNRELDVVTPAGDGDVAVRVVNTRPVEIAAEATLSFHFESTRFLRGDVNQSGEVDLSDAVALLGYLFRGGAPPECFAALDADRTGIVELTDAVVILSYLFLDGSPPVAPFPECNPDPLGDLLECPESRSCAAAQ